MASIDVPRRESRSTLRDLHCGMLRLRTFSSQPL